MLRIINGIYNQSGQALVETAIALPILLILSFMVVDAGRGFAVRNIINHIARDGVRSLATDPRLNENYSAPSGSTHEDAINSAITDVTARIASRLALVNGLSTPLSGGGAHVAAKSGNLPSSGSGIEVRIPGFGGVPGSIRDILLKFELLES